MLNHFLQDKKAAEEQQTREDLYALREKIKKEHSTVSETNTISVGFRLPSGEKLQSVFQTSSTAVVGGQIEYHDYI